MFPSRVETGSPEGWGRVRNGGGRDTLYCLLLLKELKYCLFNDQIKVDPILSFLYPVFGNFLWVLENWELR